jgi:hypothetical protein
MLRRAKQRPTLFGLGFKISHSWVEHPDVLMSAVGFRFSTQPSSHFFSCQQNPTKRPKIEPSPFISLDVQGLWSGDRQDIKTVFLVG